SGYAFFEQYDLKYDFKFNMQANHEKLAKHTFEHELQYERVNNILGSVDANQGHPLLGWDTDEFPSDLYATTLSMYEILKNGGLGRGGLNFDAKVRRGSIEQEDLFRAHIVGMDSFAVGLKFAQRLLDDQVFGNILTERYKRFKEGNEKDIIEGKTNFHKLEEHVLDLTDIDNQSGRLEEIKATINQYLLTTFAEI